MCLHHDVECIIITCQFVTAVGWANDEIKNAASKFHNIDLAAFENIHCCIAIKLWNNYVVRTKLLLA